MTIDLEAIRARSARYLGIADRLDDKGNLPDLSSSATASAIGFAASLTAADVLDLLAEVDRLRTELGNVAAAEVTRHPAGCGCTSCADIRQSVLA